MNNLTEFEKRCNIITYALNEKVQGFAYWKDNSNKDSICITIDNLQCV